jgi:hypothetical protein
MAYKILSDLLVLIHLGFIVFVVLGALLVVRWPKLAWLHVPAAVWGVLIEWTGWICPLTPLENHFRALGGESGYSGGFIEHYIVPLIYPPGLAHETQLILGIAVIVINGVGYGLVMARRRQR